MWGVGADNGTATGTPTTGSGGQQIERGDAYTAQYTGRDGGTLMESRYTASLMAIIVV